MYQKDDRIRYWEDVSGNDVRRSFLVLISTKFVYQKTDKNISETWEIYGKMCECIISSGKHWRKFLKLQTFDCYSAMDTNEITFADSIRDQAFACAEDRKVPRYWLLKQIILPEIAFLVVNSTVMIADVYVDTVKM